MILGRNKKLACYLCKAPPCKRSNTFEEEERYGQRPWTHPVRSMQESVNSCDLVDKGQGTAEGVHRGSRGLGEVSGVRERINVIQELHPTSERHGYSTRTDTTSTIKSSLLRLTRAASESKQNWNCICSCEPARRVAACALPGGSLANYLPQQDDDQLILSRCTRTGFALFCLFTFSCKFEERRRCIADKSTVRVFTVTLFNLDYIWSGENDQKWAP